MSSFEDGGNRQIPRKKLYTFSSPTIRISTLILDENMRYLQLKFINKHLCAAPDIWVEASYTYLLIKINRCPSFSSALWHYKSYPTPNPGLDWSNTALLLSCHHYGNRPAQRSLKTVSLNFTSVKIMLNSLATFSVNFSEGLFTASSPNNTETAVQEETVI